MCLPPANRKTAQVFANSQIRLFTGAISAVPTLSVDSRNHCWTVPLINTLLPPNFSRFRHLRSPSVGVNRYDNNKGRYVNDKTHKVPYAKMANIFTYKAHLDGRECRPVNEYDTSVTCWRCGSKKTNREVQGRLECGDCGLEDNAGKNGASNIGKRAVGKTIQRPLSTVGAVVTQPETQVVLNGTNGEMEPANSPDDVGLTLSEGRPRR